MQKKLLAICLTLALAATAFGGATLAYFTDVTDVKENVFTVGNVDITLTEPEWDENGSEDAPEVYPGEALAKDPIVENTGDNPCFIRVQVAGLDCLGDAGNITYRTDYVDGKLGDGWVLHTDGYFYYAAPLVVAGTEGESWNAGLVSKTDALFDQIVIPTGLQNGDGTTEFSVDVVAQAVQAQGAKASWADVKAMTVPEIAAWFATCGM